MSQSVPIIFQDPEGVSYTNSVITLSCPVCGETEVVVAPADGDRLAVHEDTPNSSPLGTPGPWWVVPLMCCDEDCNTLFGLVFAEEGLTTIVGCALPGDDEDSEYEEGEID